MKKHIAMITAVLTLLIASCAPELQRVDTSGLFWPKPPEKTRIRFITAINSDIDAREISSSEKFFGIEVKYVFTKPSDVVVDRDGNIYVADMPRGGLYEINLEKQIFQPLDLPGVTLPLGLGYNHELNWLGVTDNGKNTVMIYSLPDKKLVFELGVEKEFENPTDVAIDSKNGLIYIADSKRHFVKAFNLEGKFVRDIGKQGSGLGQLFSPTQITVDAEGRLYVVETFNFRFQIFNPDGTPLKFIGEHGDAPGMFSRPKGVAVDPEGHIFVSDAAFGNIQILDIEGNIYMDLGANGRGLGRFSIPQGLYIDNNYKLYVVDQDNRRIQIFQILTDKFYESHPEEETKTQEMIQKFEGLRKPSAGGAAKPPENKPQ